MQNKIQDKFAGFGRAFKPMQDRFNAKYARPMNTLRSLFEGKGISKFKAILAARRTK
jgi:hypothetical protein